MTRNYTDIKLIERVCCKDPEAMDFLANHWAPYCHAVDDCVDDPQNTHEQLLATFARAIMLYSHPFYVRNLLALRQVALNITHVYAQTVAWEKSELGWQRIWADHHRHVSNEMVVAVATICGGYVHARTVVPELRVMAYAEHHKGDQPV